MNGMPRLERTDTPVVPLSELQLSGLLDQREQNRQSAIAVLQAAARTDDAVERNRLRRQAAELILPRKPATAS